jgi:hypothetical protein
MVIFFDFPKKLSTTNNEESDTTILRRYYEITRRVIRRYIRRVKDEETNKDEEWQTIAVIQTLIQVRQKVR